MRVFAVLLATVTLAAASARAQRAQRGSIGSEPSPVPRWATATAPLVLRGVTVIDVESGRRQPAQTVVIVGNRIRRIGPASAVRLPARAHVVQARGKYLIPGLWDMHVHPLAAVDVFYPLFIAYGLTGVRDAGSNVPLATLARWKQEIAAGTRVGPRLVVAGPAITECPALRAESMICVATPAEARHVVDVLKLAGADFIKVHDPMRSREVLLALVSEARRLGIPIGGHFPEEPGVSGQDASDSGVRFLDHWSWFKPNVCGERWTGPTGQFDASQCAAAIAQLRQNGTWVVETPMSFSTLLPAAYGDGVRRYYPDSILKLVNLAALDLEASRDSAPSGSLAQPNAARPGSFATWQAAWQTALRRQTIRPSDVAEWRTLPIVAGTDVAAVLQMSGLDVPGYGLHAALVSFVLRGMTPLEALQTATLNPAKALHATDSLGTVATGKLADLILLDGDPFVDITNTQQIRAVIADGRYFDRAALDQLLAQAQQAAHR